MEPKAKAFLRLALTAALAAPCVPALADDPVKPNLKMGRLEFHPYVRMTGTYDSNIYMQPRSRVTGNNANNNAAGPITGSFIHKANVGLKTEYPYQSHKFGLGYDYDQSSYEKDPQRNNSANHKVDGSYGFKGPRGLLFNLKDGYLTTSDPATSELVERNRRWQNTIGGSLEWGPEGGKWFAAMEAEHTLHKYVSDNPNLRFATNRYEQSGGVRLGWKYSPKTRFYAFYRRQIVHYTVGRRLTNVQTITDPDKNSKSHLVDFGVQGDIAPKLSGQIQTGFSYRQYDSNSVPDPNTGAAVEASPITRNWTIATRLNYKPLARTTLGVGLSRAITESTSNPNRFYISTLGSLSVTQKLPFKLTANASGSWGVDKYPELQTIGTLTAQRRDDLYQAAAGLDYDIQEWLRTGVSYLYRSKNSIFGQEFNYRDHQTSMTASLLF